MRKTWPPCNRRQPRSAPRARAVIRFTVSGAGKTSKDLWAPDGHLSIRGLTFFLGQFCRELCHVDHGALVRAFADFFLFIEGFHPKLHPSLDDCGDLAAERHVHSDG